MLRKKLRLEHGALQRRLFFTILAGLVPLVLLSYLTLIQNAESHKRQLIEALQNSTRALNGAIDAELEVSLSALDTLASSSRLKTGDLAGFHGEARELLARRPNWANVVLSTPQAEQLVNARLPYGAKLPRRVSSEAVEQVAWSGKPAVGNITDSPVLGGPAFAVHVRATRPDGTVYVLSAPIWPTSISNLIASQRVPEKSLVTVLDSRGVIVARSLDHAGLVGKNRPRASSRFWAKHRRKGGRSRPRSKAGRSTRCTRAPGRAAGSARSACRWKRSTARSTAPMACWRRRSCSRP